MSLVGTLLLAIAIHAHIKLIAAFLYLVFFGFLYLVIVSMVGTLLANANAIHDHIKLIATN